MKTTRFLMMAIAGCFAFISCNSDDDSNNTNASLVGTYQMTEWNSPTATDFNGDGVASTNLMLETNCYNNSKLTLNGDGTYSKIYNAMGISGVSTSCEASQSSSGTWTRNGNTITTSSTVDGDVNYSFTAASGTSGATLNRTMTNIQYPVMNGLNAEWATGNVTTVYARQTVN